MTVYDGATVEDLNGGATALPTDVYIHGDGGTGDGAIRHVNKPNFYPDITVASDAMMYHSAAMTTTLHGDIAGPGVLTLTGNVLATHDLDGTYNFAISGASANHISADSGTVNISDATLSVSGETGASESEYVVIDFSSGGTVAGEFVATNDLDVGWTIEYAGTVSNPDAVVLVNAASTTTVIKFL